MKTKLQVLGAASTRSNHLAASVEASARRLGLDYEMEIITDLARFADFGVLVTPALLVDGSLRVAGRIPKEAEIDMLLSQRRV